MWTVKKTLPVMLEYFGNFFQLIQLIEIFLAINALTAQESTQKRISLPFVAAVFRLTMLLIHLKINGPCYVGETFI